MSSSSNNHIKTIALIGASGNVGAQILSSLLASPSSNFTITAVSRTDSKSTFPNHPSVTVKRGDYSDPAFLASAFKGQDVLVLALGFMAMGEQDRLIEAAVQAGVEWILPTEYAGDGANDTMIDQAIMFQPKRTARQLISRLSAEQNGGRTKWMGVATNPWVPFSIQTGLFSVNPYEKMATLYSDAGQFNVSTLEQVGRGVAALLFLPVSDEKNPRASLQHYANNFVYISSPSTTQHDLFAAALKATNTSESDWGLTQSTCAERLRVANEKFAEGNLLAGADATYALYMGEGLGGDDEAKAKEDREVLGLREESVERIMEQAVELGAFSVM